MTNYEKALLDVLAYAEGTLGTSNNGYDVIFSKKIIIGWTENTKIVHGMSDWSIKWVDKNGKNRSSNAAGRYQFVGSTWTGQWTGGDKTKDGQNVPLSKKNQDAIALSLIKGKRKVSDSEINDLENIDTFASVMLKLVKEWASLPTADGSGYYDGQGGDKTVGELYDIFIMALDIYKNKKGRDAGSSFGT